MEIEGSRGADSIHGLHDFLAGRVVADILVRMDAIRVDGYRILEVLGEGGMGVVYLAEQTGPVVRRVALKVLRTSLSTPTARSRFEIERQVLARLSHANIAQLYDAGTTDDGLPYFAMECVEGESLIEYAERKRLGMSARIAIFRQVCAAVQHAHQRGILHRDIKPSNVLVREEDGRAAVKLIDFGIARLMHDDAEAAARLTVLGFVGTPAYMAPEAFAGGDVDTRGDVYSLGMVLLELLTGNHPFRRATAAEVARAHGNNESIDPVATWTSNTQEARTALLESYDTSPASFALELKGDLGAILSKALNFEREERYESVESLVRDLQRFENGFPVEARVGTGWYTTWKFLQRNRVAVIATAAVVVSMAAGALVAIAEARRAAVEGDVASATTEFLVDLFEVADPSASRGESITVKEVLDRGAERLAEDPDIKNPELRSRMLVTVGRVYRNLGLYDHSLDLLRRARELPGSDAALARLECELGQTLLYRQNPGDDPATHYRRCLEVLEHLYGADDVSVARARTGLAKSIMPASQHAEALRLAELSVQSLRKVDSIEDLIDALESAGSAAIDTGQLPLSEKYLREALALAESRGDSVLQQTAFVLNTLSICLKDQGRTEEAIGASKRSIEINRKLLGLEHPSLAFPLHNLAVMLEEAGRALEALAMIEQSMRIAMVSFGEGHWFRGYVKRSAATIVLALGETERAEMLARDGLDILKAAKGAQHPRTMVAQATLAKVLLAKGDASQALALARPAMNVIVASWGEESPHAQMVSQLIADATVASKTRLH